MHGMEIQYLDLLSRVLDEGTRQHNRTGVDTFRIEGAMLEGDLTEGFPAITTKKLAFNAVKGELIGFLRGYDNAAKFRELDCKIWDQNANENETWLNNPLREGTDDLGRIYGVQWRNWRTGTSGGDFIDQLEQALLKILFNPSDRRNIITAWNPGELHMMALPPCHVMHQYIANPATRELSLCMYQRSCDMFLGIPFNIASYALLLELVAYVTGYRAKKLIMFLADVHVYENHIEQAKEQLTREPYAAPRLEIRPANAVKGAKALDQLLAITPDDIKLVDYQSWPAIKAPMAV